MSKTLETTIVIRNDSSTNFKTKNTLLARGELAVESDTRKIKVGDGITKWNDLAYANIIDDDLVLASLNENGLLSKELFKKLTEIAEGATKVEVSLSNGYIKINGTETKVYEIPTLLSPDIIDENDDKQFLSKAEKVLLNNNTKIKNEKKTTITLGGIKERTSLKDNEISTVFNKLLYPERPPEIDILNYSLLNNYYEIGEELTYFNFNFNAIQYSNDISKITATLNDTAYNFQLRSDLEGGYNYPNSIKESEPTPPIINTDTDLVLTISDINFNESSKTIQIRFVDPIYYGILGSSIIEPTSDQLKGLTKVIDEPNEMNVEYNCNKGKLCFAVPATSVVTKITDWNGLNITPSFSKQVVTVRCLDDVPRPYNVYLSDVTTVNNKMINFIISK